MMGTLDSYSGTRPYVYREILGGQIYDTLSSKNRRHIFVYARRHHLGEVALLRSIAEGKITISQIESDHAKWREQQH